MHSEAGLRSSGLGLPLGDLGDGCATASGSGLYGAPTLTRVQHGSDAGIARNVLDAPPVSALGLRLGLSLSLPAATIVVESRDSSFAPPPGGAPELAGVDPASVAELGELVNGTRRGRTTPVQITLYKSVGVAVQDLAAAALVLAAAQERGAGLTIELEEIHA